MIKYYKTTGIYRECDTIRIEVKYNKDKGGYYAYLTPCFKQKYCYGTTYCAEYYTYYGGIDCLLVPCGRKSAKKEQEAADLLLENIDNLLEKYVQLVSERGGRYIEIIGEYTED